MVVVVVVVVVVVAVCSSAWLAVSVVAASKVVVVVAVSFDGDDDNDMHDKSREFCKDCLECCLSSSDTCLARCIFSSSRESFCLVGVVKV